ncbi:hypothetical protein M5K25_002241 [Dendrobium thyrsiflorum]|uniref:Uncharacterized protein n=1 Tax=Dendrobium thyrsiflorum TaxID=117978 RepID=A0ABD0VTW5_DENTH
MAKFAFPEAPSLILFLCFKPTRSITGSHSMPLLFGGFTGFGRRSARKGESYLHGERAPVLTSDQNVVTSDPARKGNVVEGSNNNEGAEEATREILHRLRSKEAKQQRRKKEKKSKP